MVGSLEVCALATQQEPFDAFEPPAIQSDQGTSSIDRGRRDQQIVGTPWAALASGISQQPRVNPRRIEVIVLHRDRGEHLFDEGHAASPSARIGELDADQELRGGHRSYRDIVIVMDRLVERARRRSAATSTDVSSTRPQRLQDLES